MKTTGLIMTALGILLLAVGGYLFAREQLFLRSADHALAVVTDNSVYTYTSNDYGVQHYYCSKFQFQTTDGQSVSLEESDSTNISCGDLDQPPDYQTGQQVPVYYDPRNPTESAQIPKSVKQSYDGTMIIAIGGILLLAIGLGLYWSGFLRGRGVAAAGSRPRSR